MGTPSGWRRWRNPGPGSEAGAGSAAVHGQVMQAHRQCVESGRSAYGAVEIRGGPWRTVEDRGGPWRTVGGGVNAGENQLGSRGAARRE